MKNLLKKKIFLLKKKIFDLFDVDAKIECSGKNLCWRKNFVHGEGKPISEQRKAYVQQYQKNCVSDDVIMKYDSIDQGESCACSFVGFLNLCRLYNMIHKDVVIPEKDVGNWKKIWDSFKICAATDIALTRAVKPEVVKLFFFMQVIK